MSGVGNTINNGGSQGPRGAKPDFRQMPVSPEMQNILKEQGHPTAANLGELQSFMTKLQGENPGAYQRLFEAMHPGLYGKGIGDLANGLPKSVIDNIGR